MAIKDVIYTDFRYLLNPDSEVPIVVSSGHSKILTVFFVPFHGFLVRIIKNATTGTVSAECGRLANKKIVFKDSVAYTTPSDQTWEGLYWYKKLNINNAAALDKSMSADRSFDFEFTNQKFFTPKDLNMLSTLKFLPNTDWPDYITKYLFDWTAHE